MKIILNESQFERLLSEQVKPVNKKSDKNVDPYSQIKQGITNVAKNVGNATKNAYTNVSNTATNVSNSYNKWVADAKKRADGSKPQHYEDCITSENPNTYKLGQLNGRYYAVPNPLIGKGYYFYSDGTVLCPDNKIRKYTCNNTTTLVDGVDVVAQSWASDPRNAPTEWEKREAKKAQEFGDRFGKRILEPIHDFYVAHPTITTIGVSFIPTIGPWIAGALVTDQTVDAWNNAKTDEEKGWIALGAACNLIFGMKLGVNALTSTVLKKVENATFKTIADKITSGKANELTTNEVSILQEVGNNKTQITGFINDISSLKPTYIQRFGQQKYETLLEEFVTGKIDKNVFIKILKSAEKSSIKSANFVSQYGIKFSQNELNQIHQYTNFIKRLPKVLTKDVLNSINPTIEVMTIDGPKTIRLKFITSKQAVKMWGEKYKDIFGGALDNEIYFIVDNIKKMSPTDLDQLFYHEFAHVKDPSMVSSKLNQSYNSNVVRYSDEYFSNKYYFHPRELVANTAKILNGLSTNVKNIMKTMGKDRVIQGLDDIISWSKGVKKDFTQDMTKILGYDQKYVREHFDFLQKNPTEYRNLVSKVAQQAEYLKSQVNLAKK
jgi:hypothetical protein